MTWLGWILAVEMTFSGLAMFYKAGQGDTIRTPRMALIQGVEMLVFAVLILLVGTGSLL